MKITGQKPLDPKEIGSGKPREIEQRAKHQGKASAEQKLPPDSRTSLTSSRVKEAIRNTPDIRTDRVEAVKSKIQSGAYKVNVERLASNMLTESLRDDIDKDR